MPSSVNKQSLSPRRARPLADRLLDWYRREARDLPWRRTRDPYRIWVSEIMLQQTRVESVLGRYERFLARFPDVRSLAAADEKEVLAEWAGLGYYRRARQLHAAARQVVESGGELPTSSAALRLLPGFGRYTAGAVASIAFGEEVSAVDGNVERVLARLLALESDPKRGPGAEVIRESATRLLRGRPPSELNQALMELGATICTPTAPRCPSCPWTRSCRARQQGVVELLPRRSPRPQPLDVACYAAVARRGAALLWRRRGPEEHNAGLWELPTTVWHGGEPDAARGERDLRALGESLQRGWKVGPPLTEVRHGITRHRIRVVAREVVDCDAAAAGDLAWAEAPEAERWGLTAAARKLLRRLPTLL